MPFCILCETRTKPPTKYINDGMKANKHANNFKCMRTIRGFIYVFKRKSRNSRERERARETTSSVGFQVLCTLCLALGVQRTIKNHYFGVALEIPACDDTLHMPQKYVYARHIYLRPKGVRVYAYELTWKIEMCTGSVPVSATLHPTATTQKRIQIVVQMNDPNEALHTHMNNNNRMQTKRVDADNADTISTSYHGPCHTLLCPNVSQLAKPDSVSIKQSVFGCVY